MALQWTETVLALPRRRPLPLVVLSRGSRGSRGSRRPRSSCWLPFFSSFMHAGYYRLSGTRRYPWSSMGMERSRVGNGQITTWGETQRKQGRKKKIKKMGTTNISMLRIAVGQPDKTTVHRRDTMQKKRWSVTARLEWHPAMWQQPSK